MNVSASPLDNISFHSEESVQKWKFVYQIRTSCERELRKNFLEWKEVINLLKDSRLMKIVSDIRPYYEILVKDFIMNLSPNYSIKGSQEYMNVFVRGKCVKFLTSFIGDYLGRNKSVESDRVISMDKKENEITIG